MNLCLILFSVLLAISRASDLDEGHDVPSEEDETPVLLPSESDPIALELLPDPSPAELLPDEIEEVMEESVNSIMPDEIPPLSVIPESPVAALNDTAVEVAAAANDTTAVDEAAEAEAAAAKKAKARRIICKLVKDVEDAKEEEETAVASAEGEEAATGNGTMDQLAAQEGAVGEEIKASGEEPVTLDVLSLMSDEEAVPAAPPSVSIVNGTHFMHILSDTFDSNVTNRSVPAHCHLAMFYASWCPFSAKAAPHYNAIARLFPDLEVLAVDSYKHYGLNSQYGVMSLPTLMLFHNGRPMHKFNGSEFLIDHFSDYITSHSNLESAGEPQVLEEDLRGPVPTEPVPATDYYLYLSWAFVILVCLGQFGKSAYCQRIVEALRNNWREAEIQHEHQD